MAEGPAIVATDLVKRFGDFTAVDHLSLTVAAGEIFGFLGPNGAGKSTTIRMLCGLLVPTAGAGTVAGYDIRRETTAIKRRVGYMSQRFSLYDDLTVEQNITFFGGVYGLKGDRLQARRQWILDMADLHGHRQSLTAMLSGGWKQRLALGCALIHEPAILFLDEPTSGVDPRSRRQFWDLIYDLAGTGITTLVSTHYMDEAEYCDRIALIYRGRLIAAGTPAELKSDHMPDTILEIRCRRPQDRLDALAAVPGVREIALFGPGLHAVVATGTDPLPALRQALADDAGATVERVMPSMEDVFVSLVEAYDRRPDVGGRP